MKIIFKTILVALCFTNFIAKAQQKVALHGGGNTTIYSSLNPFLDAYNASVNGDTIYLPGGSFTPPTNFDKKITVFGAGHYIDSALVTGKTVINGDVLLKENADGFYMEGLEILGKISFSYNQSVNGVIIKRCKVNATFEVLGDLSNPSQNIALIGNVFIGSIFLGNAQTVLISNNIIRIGIDATNGNIINNNIFLAVLGNGYYENFRGNNNNLWNNIFVSYGSYGITTSYSGNDYRNNLITYLSPSYGTAPTLINNYTGIPQATIFVNQTGTSFDYSHNYHLQDPVTYLGTDGSEVGIYGGDFPYKEGAVPVNPHIQLKNINTQTDNNGDLNIQLKVNAQDN